MRFLIFFEFLEELKDKIRNFYCGYLEWKIVKINFFGEVIVELILISVIKKFDVDINVFYGNIDYI